MRRGDHSSVEWKINILSGICARYFMNLLRYDAFERDIEFFSRRLARRNVDVDVCKGRKMNAATKRLREIKI